MSIHNQKSRQAQRRRSKWIGLIIAEAIAIGVLILAGALALLLRTADPILATLANIATIAACAAVAMIPIIIFGISPILPRADH